MAGGEGRRRKGGSEAGVRGENEQGQAKQRASDGMRCVEGTNGARGDERLELEGGDGAESLLGAGKEPCRGARPARQLSRQTGYYEPGSFRAGKLGSRPVRSIGPW